MLYSGFRDCQIGNKPLQTTKRQTFSVFHVVQIWRLACIKEFNLASWKFVILGVYCSSTCLGTQGCVLKFYVCLGIYLALACSS